MLVAVRRSCPAEAESLLTKTWKDDSPDQRAAFIGEMGAGLSMHDERFLEEHALNDRRKEVRLQAASLLGLLPESRLTQRMIDRLRPLIKLSERTFNITLPEELDKATMRDGIASQKSTDKRGERSSWLYQMLSSVSPKIWENEFGLPPAELLKRAFHSQDWHDVLIDAWAAAALRHQDSEWCQALLSYYPGDGSDLVQTLAPEAREAIALAALASNNWKITTRDTTFSFAGGIIPDAPKHQPLWHLLKGCVHQWSKDFSVRILDCVRRELTLRRSTDAGQIMRKLGFCIHVSVAEGIDDFLPDQDQLWAEWRTIVATFRESLAKRYEIHVAMLESSMESTDASPIKGDTHV